MFLKFLAGLIMGLVVALLSYLVVAFGAGSGESGIKLGGWAALGGFGLTVILAIRAASARFAWGRGMLLSGLLSLAMPLASIAFTAMIGHEHIQSAGSDAARAGAAIGVGLGGGLLTMVSGVIGLFLGLIFLISALLLLRSPRVVVAPATSSSHADEKKCPACAEWIKREAVKCRFCGSELKAAMA